MCRKVLILFRLRTAGGGTGSGEEENFYYVKFMEPKQQYKVWKRCLGVSVHVPPLEMSFNGLWTLPTTTDKIAVL